MARSGVTGVKAHNERLSRMISKGTEARLGKVVYRGADKVRVEARRLIADGAVQGKGHVASAPGEAPNWDTGELANGITTRKVGAMQAHTASTAAHSDPLENGTSVMAERPFMRPAAANKRSEVTEDVLNEVNRVVRRK